jgi:hypothetical protein
MSGKPFRGAEVTLPFCAIVSPPDSRKYSWPLANPSVGSTIPSM